MKSKNWSKLCFMHKAILKVFSIDIVYLTLNLARRIAFVCPISPKEFCFIYLSKYFLGQILGQLSLLIQLSLL